MELKHDLWVVKILSVVSEETGTPVCHSLSHFPRCFEQKEINLIIREPLQISKIKIKSVAFLWVQPPLPCLSGLDPTVGPIITSLSSMVLIGSLDFLRISQLRLILLYFLELQVIMFVLQPLYCLYYQRAAEMV